MKSQSGKFRRSGVLPCVLALAAMPAASQNSAGLGRNSTCGGGRCGAGIPPDSDSDVGRNCSADDHG